MAFATLIESLAIVGSRKSDGTANASGRAWFYAVDTTTPATVYSDADATAALTQPVTLDASGKVPSATGGPFVTGPVRVLVEYVVSTGTYATLSDYTFLCASAPAVAVRNDGFTGTEPDGTTTAGGDTDLDSVLTSLAASVGGTDGKYLESGGATQRTIKAKLAEAGISVLDFGAKGDGVAIDTTAFQAAINRAVALSTNVIVPAGTYKIDQALTVTSATGVSIRGAGLSASKIITTSTTLNAFTLTSCAGLTMEGISISATATNSGSAVSMSGCSYTTLRSVRVNTSGGGTFLIPITSSGSSTNLRLENCDLTSKAADATARVVKLTNTSGVAIVGGYMTSGTGAAGEFAGTTGSVTVANVLIGGTGTGFLWTSGMTGTDFTIYGCPGLRPGLSLFTTPFDLSALSTDPRLRQWGNEVDGTTVDVTTGGTVTPNRANGPELRIRGTTTGSAYVIAAPTPTPRADGTSNGMYDVLLRLTFYNNAAGAVTGWTLNAVYHTTGAISTVDGNLSTVTFRWDPSASVWREIARTVTT